MVRRAILLGSAAFLLAGCFDGHYDLGLKNDGSGRIAVDIILDKDLTRDILKGGKDKLESQKPDSDLGKNTRTSQRVENGSLIVSQVLDFKSLSEITGGGVAVEVTGIGRNMMGMTRSRIRVSTGDNPSKSKKDPGGIGDRMIDDMFKGHEMRMAMHLPCTVENADPITSDGAVFAPKVEKSWFGGSIVTWHVPMSAMIGDHAGRRDFVATCWSFSGITPGKSRTK